MSIMELHDNVNLASLLDLLYNGSEIIFLYPGVALLDYFINIFPVYTLFTPYF